MNNLIEIVIHYENDFQVNKLLSMGGIIDNNPALNLARLRVDERRILFIEALNGINKVVKTVDNDL